MEEEIRRKVSFFIKKLIETFNGRLLSVIAYGSSADGSYVPGKSDINLLVVVGELTFEDMRILRKTAVRNAVRNGISPFFFTPEFIRGSADTFAVEWKEMKEKRLVLFGSDIIKDIQVENRDLLLQLEREIKQNYVRFQHAMIFDPDIHYALGESFRTLKVFLRNSYRAMGKKIERPPYFSELERILDRKPFFCRKEKTESLARQHLAFLGDLLQSFDKPAGT